MEHLPSEPTGKSVSIVVVTFNSVAHIQRFLDECEHLARRVQLECIVVDAASSDETCRSVSQWQEKPDKLGAYSLVALDENEGFPRAANRGASLARGEVLVFLNPDVSEFADGVIACSEALMADPQLGLCGPSLSDQGGQFLSEADRRLPSGYGLFIRSLGLGAVARLLWRASRRSAQVRILGAGVKVRTTQAVSGAFMATSNAVFEAIGALDERLFMYLEDVEYAQRTQLAGYRVACILSAGAIHDSGQSRRTVSASARELDQLLGEVPWILANDRGRSMDARLAELGALIFAARRWVRGGSHRDAGRALIRWVFSPKPNYVSWRPSYAIKS